MHPVAAANRQWVADELHDMDVAHSLTADIVSSPNCPRPSTVHNASAWSRHIEPVATFMPSRNRHPFARQKLWNATGISLSGTEKVIVVRAS